MNKQRFSTVLERCRHKQCTFNLIKKKGKKWIESWSQGSLSYLLRTKGRKYCYCVSKWPAVSFLNLETESSDIMVPFWAHSTCPWMIHQTILDFLPEKLVPWTRKPLKKAPLFIRNRKKISKLYSWYSVKSMGHWGKYWTGTPSPLVLEVCHLCHQYCVPTLNHTGCALF